MKIHVTSIPFTDVFGDLVDMNFLLLQIYKNPLIVVEKVSQGQRIKTWCEVNNSFLTGTKQKIIYWGALIKEGYLQEKKESPFVLSKWQEHDVVIFTTSSVGKEPDREIYNLLIEQLVKLFKK